MSELEDTADYLVIVGRGTRVSSWWRWVMVVLVRFQVRR